MRIAEVAREAGASVYTVRFYQRRKLLPEPPRSSANYRNYSRRAVELLRAIKGAQSVGFTLFEIQQLIQISGKDSKAPREIRAVAKAKVRELDQKIQNLCSGRSALLRILNSCKCGEGRDICVVVKRFGPEEELK